MSVTAIIAICVLLLVLLVIARRLLRLAMVAVVLVGAALSLGLVGMPRAISGPVDQVQAEVHTWQKHKSAELVCAEKSMKAAESTEAPEAPAPCK
jgi:predicted acyltransferase